jgi:hypothetical protein
MEDFDIVLLPDFDTPREEVQRTVAVAHASGKELAIEFKIAGQFSLTDTQRLAEQFLYAAYIGESIATACAKFECMAPSSIQAHESVEFYVIIKDVDAFMIKLWDTIPGLMTGELQEQAGLNEEWAAQCWGEAWDLLDSPEQAPHTHMLIEHAQEMLRKVGYDEEE